MAAFCTSAPAEPATKPKKSAAHGRAPRHGRGSQKPPEFVGDADKTPAGRYAALDPEGCTRELGKRNVHFTKQGPTPGVLIPIRVSGEVAGVLYRTDYPDGQRSKVPYEVFDCRLVLALFDFGAVLRDHDIVEVRMFSAWRPPPKSWPAGKIADRHPGGLAADLRLFKKSTGEELSVEKSFPAEIGAAPCGRGGAPPSPAGPAPPIVGGDGGSRELHDILCRAAAARIFHVLLSPNFDRAHHNHFHVEVRRGVGWFIVR